MAGLNEDDADFEDLRRLTANDPMECFVKICRPDPAGWNAFCRALASNDQVTEVDLGIFVRSTDPSDSVQETYWRRLCETLGRFQLKSLSLHFCDLEEASEEEMRVCWLSRVNTVFQHVCFFKELILFYENGDEEAAIGSWDQVAVAVLTEALHGHPHLESFAMKGFAWNDPFLSLPLLATLEMVPNLTKANFDSEQFTRLNHRAVERMLRLPLHQLGLRFVIPASACNIFRDQIKVNSTLRQLYLQSQRLAAPSCLRGIADNTCLREFTLTTEMDFRHYSALAHIVRQNKNIETLKVHDQNRNADGAAVWMKYFFESFKYNTTIKTLTLIWSAGVSNGYELRPLRYSNIENLSFDLWNDEAPYPETEHLCYIVAGNQFLKKLHWWSSFRTTRFLRQDLLIQAISSPQTALESLTIGLSETVWKSKDACQDSMLAFLRETQLKDLWFFGHYGPLTTRPGMDMQLFQDALRMNFHLESMTITPPGPDKDIKQFCNIVGRLNQAGRRYLLKEKPSLSQGINVLASVTDSLDCLYYHLRENPAFCDVPVPIGEK